MVRSHVSLLDRNDLHGAREIFVTSRRGLDPARQRSFAGAEIDDGERVSVSGGNHEGGGVVDAVDLSTGKIWVRFDPMGPAFPMIFWVNAMDATKT